nr:cache domain-containing protein [uncultured Gemmiger sp.]
MRGNNTSKRVQKTVKRDRTLWLNIALIVVFFAVMSLGIYLVRDKLLYNANEMGNNLAQSYSNEEETRISIYEMFLTMCSLYTNASIDQQNSDQVMQQGLEEYTDYMSQVLGANIIDPYAVINGKIVAANPWEGDEEYDYSQKEWYTNALSANGKIVFSDVYVDAITGQKLVTLSVKLHGEGNVLAFDILMDNFHALKNKIELPEDSAYFLFDASGSLIYLTGGYDVDDAAVQQYAANMRHSFWPVCGTALSKAIPQRSRGWTVSCRAFIIMR